MIAVKPIENESFESLIRRFKRKVSNSKIMKNLEDKRYFKSKSEQNRTKKKRAKKRKQTLTSTNE